MSVTLKQLLEAGVHFGHRPRYWNPKMAPYIFGVRNDLHIINLEKTQAALNEALKAVTSSATQGGTIIFVGTKFAAQDLIAEQAKACNMPYINRRWLGGMLTNYKTIRQSVKRLKDLEYELEHTELSQCTKKERLSKQRALDKLNATLGGIKDMNTLPDMLLVIDVGQEQIAVAEARKLGIPVIGVVDTNSDPDGIDYMVPGNDDAMRSIALYTQLFAEAIRAARVEIEAQAAEKAAQIVHKVDQPAPIPVADKASVEVIDPSHKQASETLGDLVTADVEKEILTDIPQTVVQSAAASKASVSTKTSVKDSAPVAEKTASKSSAKKTPASTTQSPAAKKPTVKKPAAKKPAAKKLAAKKPAAKKPAAKKPAAKTPEPKSADEASSD